MTAMTRRASPTSSWRNRITGSGEEAPDQLLANPANWRIHPKAQQDALAGALDAVGWVQQVLVNRRSGFVVDGHARVALALARGEPSVPALYVDLAPEEEALVLATLDPIGAMAGVADVATHVSPMSRLMTNGAPDRCWARVSNLRDPDRGPG